MELDGHPHYAAQSFNHAALVGCEEQRLRLGIRRSEVPLIEGVSTFAAAGIKAFGPNKYRPDRGSKFAKQLMERHDIPTAKYQTDDLDRSAAYVRERGCPIVIKADGLAAGKGVTVAMDDETAIAALEDISSITVSVTPVPKWLSKTSRPGILADELRERHRLLADADFAGSQAPTMRTRARTPAAWAPTARCRKSARM